MFQEMLLIRQKNIFLAKYVFFTGLRLEIVSRCTQLENKNVLYKIMDYSWEFLQLSRNRREVKTERQWGFLSPYFAKSPLLISYWFNIGGILPLFTQSTTLLILTLDILTLFCIDNISNNLHVKTKKLYIY